MKQLLFIIITSMFVSNVYAQSYAIKETCIYYENKISNEIVSIKGSDESISKEIKKGDEVRNFKVIEYHFKEINESEERLLKASKIYHYLNCGKS